jgi:hypothetical protein
MTSVKKDTEQEDEATILSKTEVDQLSPNRGVRSVIANPPVARSGTEVCQV